jgi:hypothetical protein
MTISLHQHRLLLITATIGGLLLGGMLFVSLADGFQLMTGYNNPILHPLMLLIGLGCGAAVPQFIFRRWIAARCPHDGHPMSIERISPADNPCGRSYRASYRCSHCGKIW